MADELTAEQKKVLADQEEERAYGKFAAWLDRYTEEHKPEEDAPEKTTKPTGGFLASLFGA